MYTIIKATYFLFSTHTSFRLLILCVDIGLSSSSPTFQNVPLSSKKGLFDSVTMVIHSLVSDGFAGQFLQEVHQAGGGGPYSPH